MWHPEAHIGNAEDAKVDQWPRRCDAQGEPMVASSLAALRDSQHRYANDLVFHRIHDPAQPEFGQLCELLCRDPQYWLETQLNAVTMPVAADALRVLPPSSNPAQKYLWAIWIDGELVGCLDVVRQWPTRRTLSIGFLMIDRPLRGQGIGLAVITQLRERTRAWAAIHRWRVAVVQSQRDALRFWKSAGFIETGERQHLEAQRAPQIVLERTVGR
jgi:GNAT superfamily N-acetyltransferase